MLKVYILYLEMFCNSLILKNYLLSHEESMTMGVKQEKRLLELFLSTFRVSPFT